MDAFTLPPPDLNSGDQSALVRFMRQEKHHGVKSREAGHPVYIGVDFIEIRFAGERDAVVREVKPEDLLRWPRQWAAYQSNQNQEDTAGTSIVHLFPDSPETVANLKVMRVLTIEQLAATSDTQLQAIGMGARAWRDKAIRYLDVATKSSGFAELEAKLSARDDRISQLEKQVQDLATALQDRNAPVISIPGIAPVAPDAAVGQRRPFG